MGAQSILARGGAPPKVRPLPKHVPSSPSSKQLAQALIEGSEMNAAHCYDALDPGGQRTAVALRFLEHELFCGPETVAEIAPALLPSATVRRFFDQVAERPLNRPISMASVVRVQSGEGAARVESRSPSRTTLCSEGLAPS